MSKIQDVPFITKVIDTLSDELKSGLYDLIDGQVKTPVFRSLVNNDYAITEANDKGKVQFVTLETLRGNYTGYLAYNSVYCVLIAFKGNTQALDMLNINVAKHTFAFVNESLSILELRVELEDGKEGVTPTDLGVTNNNIHLAKGTTQIGEGVNLKTLDGNTLIGSGDIDLKTVGGETIVGSGNVGFKTINDQEIVGDGNIVVGEGGTIAIDTAFDETSTNPVQNKVVTGEFNKYKSLLENYAVNIQFKNTSANILALTSDNGTGLGTDTGHWYYWNGTQYVDGGVYQATEIGDGSIKVNMLDNDLKDLINYLKPNPNNLFNKYNYLKEENRYINSNSTIIAYDGCLIITSEVNGVSGEEYRSNMFNQAILDYSLISYVPFTSNDVPYIDMVAVEDFRATSNPNLKRCIFHLTQNAKYLNIMFRFNSKTDMENNIQNVIDGLAIKKTTKWITSYENHYLTVNESVNENKWSGKKLIWFGTSIPEGVDTAIGSEATGKSYPILVGEKLGATTINKSLGSSMARANVRTGNYVNANSYNLTRALTQTTEEKQYLIDNWSTIRSVLNDPNTYTEINSISSEVLGASFESRLMPYLDGTYEMPDLFVIDHGHNDFKTFYSLPDGTPDIDLEPTVENIQSGVLAEDTYMTDNNYYNLKRFFGDLSHIRPSQFDKFVASINRNCYKGAINFLCTLILYHNPRARIVFIGNLDSWQKEGLTEAQIDNANSWQLPLIKTWEYLGFSSHIIPNTYNFWNNSNQYDLIVKDIYCKDTVHPHSDTTGVSISNYADVIADKIKHIVV